MYDEKASSIAFTIDAVLQERARIQMMTSRDIAVAGKDAVAEALERWHQSVAAAQRQLDGLGVLDCLDT